MPDDLKEFYAKALVISVFLKYAGEDEATRKMDKLRKQIRKSMTKDTLYWKQEMVALSHHVDESYSKTVKQIPVDKHLTVQLSMAMNILYATLDGNQYQNKWFTERTFMEAVRSLGYGIKDSLDEPDTYWLVDTFLENVGYTRESAFAKKVRLAKKNKEFNDILEKG